MSYITAVLNPLRLNQDRYTSISGSSGARIGVVRGMIGFLNSWSGNRCRSRCAVRNNLWTVHGTCSTSCHVK